LGTNRAETEGTKQRVLAAADVGWWMAATAAGIRAILRQLILHCGAALEEKPLRCLSSKPEDCILYHISCIALLGFWDLLSQCAWLKKLA